MKKFPWTDHCARTRLADVYTRLEHGAPDVEHVFTQIFEAPPSPTDTPVMQTSALAGALVSVKDLFDVEGYVTRAGTVFFDEDAPAVQDAPALAKLRSAGALFVGHTNMTELAYSGLGLNPHYGTPRNALNPSAIPGGSTAGGAVSVALGLADIAIGTDTGGSLRIPAAFNGITGFKPTQASVSRGGAKALSRSLDSVGPMAKSVAECRLAFETMRSPAAEDRHLAPEFIIPENFGFDDIDPSVQTEFDKAVGRIEAAGFSVSRVHLDVLERYKAMEIWQFSAVECRGEYETYFQDSTLTFDPRVKSRMARADEVGAVRYRQTLNMRHALIQEFEAELADKCLLMPTTPIVPPHFSDVEDDADFGRLNLLALRNPSLANVMDGCSISLPWMHGAIPVGIMLTGTAGRDLSLLDLAAALEAKFSDA